MNETDATTIAIEALRFLGVKQPEQAAQRVNHPGRIMELCVWAGKQALKGKAKSTAALVLSVLDKPYHWHNPEFYVSRLVEWGQVRSDLAGVWGLHNTETLAQYESLRKMEGDEVLRMLGGLVESVRETAISAAHALKVFHDRGVDLSGLGTEIVSNLIENPDQHPDKKMLFQVVLERSAAASSQCRPAKSGASTTT